MFIDQYVKSLNSSNLMDDDHHNACMPLGAAALSDRDTGGIGSLLSRVKYADGTIHKSFEGNSANLAFLIRTWTHQVTTKGAHRGWMKTHTSWDTQAAFKLYKDVAEKSLAYWMDGRCAPCGGSGATPERRHCDCCNGTGKAQILGGRFEVEKIKDMVSELEGLLQSHNSRAAVYLRHVN